MDIEKYSLGCGDRFLHQGRAQLAAVLKARQAGVEVVPVWNKSNREHTTVGTEPSTLWDEAAAAVKALDYNGAFYVDADHITLTTVETFLDSHNFFTLDISEHIGHADDAEAIDAFVRSLDPFYGELKLEGLEEPVILTEEAARKTAEDFLYAIRQAKATYNAIAERKGAGSFITEVSVDETDDPQTPDMMFVILAAIARFSIPAQTIAPKFTGRFNKGVDYVGDLAQFEREVNADLAVLKLAVSQFDLPRNIKLSVHSGSDKFSIYPILREALQKYDAGLHLKTAGTTWLEELIGLAEAGGSGLAIAKEIYSEALAHIDELCAPYATVIDIDRSKLPSAGEVNGWDEKTYSETLRHDQSNPLYNLNFRQLLHVGYKIAGKMGDRYYDALVEHEETIARNVTENLFDRHLKPLFI